MQSIDEITLDNIKAIRERCDLVEQYIQEGKGPVDAIFFVESIAYIATGLIDQINFIRFKQE